MRSIVLTVEIEWRGLKRWIVRSLNNGFPHPVETVCFTESVAETEHSRREREYLAWHCFMAAVDFDDGFEILESEDE